MGLMNAVSASRKAVFEDEMGPVICTPKVGHRLKVNEKE
jgi:hypothetical protein